MQNDMHLNVCCKVNDSACAVKSCSSRRRKTMEKMTMTMMKRCLKCLVDGFSLLQSMGFF